MPARRHKGRARSNGACLARVGGKPERRPGRRANVPGVQALRIGSTHFGRSRRAFGLTPAGTDAAVVFPYQGGNKSCNPSTMQENCAEKSAMGRRSKSHADALSSRQWRGRGNQRTGTSSRVSPTRAKTRSVGSSRSRVALSKAPGTTCAPAQRRRVEAPQDRSARQPCDRRREAPGLARKPAKTSARAAPTRARVVAEPAQAPDVEPTKDAQ